MTLPDGIYDAFVIDARGDDDTMRVELELTITSGEHKGDVVTVHALGLDQEPIFLIGTPATLRVADGQPIVDLET